MPEKQVTADVQKSQNARVRALAVTEGDFLLTNPTLAIDTNFDVQASNAFDAVVDGALVTVATGADFDTGTEKVIAADQWAAGLLTIDADGTEKAIQWTADAATEAAAIEKLDAIEPEGELVVGYVTVLTGDGVTWTAGTDALEGGSGGTAATTTNYTAVFGWVL